MFDSNLKKERVHGQYGRHLLNGKHIFIAANNIHTPLEITLTHELMHMRMDQLFDNAVPGGKKNVDALIKATWADYRNLQGILDSTDYSDLQKIFNNTEFQLPNNPTSHAEMAEALFHLRDAPTGYLGRILGEELKGLGYKMRISYPTSISNGIISEYKNGRSISSLLTDHLDPFNHALLNAENMYAAEHIAHIAEFECKYSGTIKELLPNTHRFFTEQGIFDPRMPNFESKLPVRVRPIQQSAIIEGEILPIQTPLNRRSIKPINREITIDITPVQTPPSYLRTLKKAEFCLGLLDYGMRVWEQRAQGCSYPDALAKEIIPIASDAIVYGVAAVVAAPAVAIDMIPVPKPEELAELDALWYDVRRNQWFRDPEDISPAVTWEVTKLLKTCAEPIITTLDDTSHWISESFQEQFPGFVPAASNVFSALGTASYHLGRNIIDNEDLYNFTSPDYQSLSSSNIRARRDFEEDCE